MYRTSKIVTDLFINSITKKVPTDSICGLSAKADQSIPKGFLRANFGQLKHERNYIDHYNKI